MAAEKQTDYYVFYFKQALGRACGAVFLMVDNDIPYQEAVECENKPKGEFQGFPIPLSDVESGYNHFAFPQLSDGTDFIMAQSNALMTYLAEANGLFMGNDVVEKCHMDQLCALSEDWMNEGYQARRGVFTGDFTTGDAFIETRFNKFVETLTTNFNGCEGPYFFGEEPSFPDYRILSDILFLEYMYANRVTSRLSPELLAFKELMMSREKIKTFLEEKYAAGYHQGYPAIHHSVQRPYQIYYYEKLSGRSQPIRMLLRDIEVPFETIYTDEDSGNAYTSFMKPVLKKDETVICQTQTILKYLNEVHELFNGNNAEDRGHMAQLGATAGDLMSEALNARKPAMQGNFTPGDEFLATRLAKFLNVLRTAFEACDGDYFFGNEICWVDYIVFSSFDACEYMFGEQFTTARASFDAFVELMKSRKGVAEELEAEPVLFPTLHSSIERPN